MTTLVLIVGPIAGGKSTVARSLTAGLREGGADTALVELDQIAEMALPTLPDWSVAHEIFASVVGQWLRSTLSYVVAEGAGSPSEIARVLAAVPDGVRVVTIALTSPFPIALARAQTDPTRGVSKDPDFLAAEFERWARDLPAIDHDLLLDTSRSSVPECVAAIERVLPQRPMHGRTER